ncbi:MAG TPA: hypothetical protein VGL06_12125 [Pseudonocardiaceae bacterium]
MNTLMGIALDVWVNIDGDCPMETEVTRCEAQLELGHSTGSLHLVLDEDGLARLVAAATAALDTLRSGWPTLM